MTENEIEAQTEKVLLLLSALRELEAHKVVYGSRTQDMYLYQRLEASENECKRLDEENRRLARQLAAQDAPRRRLRVVREVGA